MRVPTIQRSAELQSPVPPVAAPPPAPVSEALVAIRAPLAIQVILGTILTILTLGVYRFWYRTALRRYYWRNTQLAGDGFEYTGTGRELFVGFLIALAIVLPIYLLVTLVGLFGGRVLGPTLAGFVGAAIMPAVVQILSYRARRYRLTRTRYRGVQFHQSGTGTSYLLRTIWWLLLTVVSLGIAFPFFRAALERYKIENTWFGSAQGAFEASAGSLMGAWMTLWVAALVCLVVLFGMPISNTTLADSLGTIYILAALVSVAFLIALPWLWLRYRVREFRTFTAGTRFGAIGFESNLTTGPVVWIWVRYVFALVALVVVLGMTVGFGGILPVVDPYAHPAVLLGVLPMLLGSAVGFLVGLALITELVFRRPLWALRVNSVRVSHLEQLDSVVQRAGLNATGIGEAFDTGFDVAG
jgi:uncharacterized membrane protein YjgN (DUF898 family)